MKDLRNFTEIFRKCEADDNINSHKKQGFTLSRKCLFGKTRRWGVKITLPHPTSISRVRKVRKVEKRKSQEADDIFGKIIKINGVHASKCDFQPFKNMFYFNTVTNKLNNF